MTETDVDVVVVGCGPVGATLGNLLGTAGMTSAIFERETDVYHLPRASHFDGEIMRVFQSVGLADAITPLTSGIDGMDFLDATGERLFGFVSPPGVGPSGWANDYMFSQPELERELRRGLDRFPTVTLHDGHEVETVTDTGDGTVVTVRDLATGTTRTVRARFVVGTDGARSITRAAIGSELDDYGFDQPWLVIDTNLLRPVDLPSVAVQYCDPNRPATFIPHGGVRRRWEIMAMPGDDLDKLQSAERVAQLLSRWIDPDEVEIVRAVVYTFHALVARNWRRNRVMIAGDSAHQMPPFLGQGMCAGIRDVTNLAWKLGAVLEGAPLTLLDSYQPEREPHARRVIETAVAAGRIIQTTDPEVARARDESFRAAGGGSGPDQSFLGPLGPGLHGFGGGTPIPQVRESDTALGSGFALVTGDRSVAAVAPDDIPVVVITELESWFRERDCDLALVRPDRYVFGTARADEVDTLVGALRAHL